MVASLLSLPLELREAIYGYLFSTITAKHGFHTTSSPHYRTAILRTNKQIHHEAWRHLPLNIRLQFRGTETMLDTLLSVDQAVVTRLRHIQVKAFPFPLYASGRADFYSIYYFHNALAMLPGLCLDQLIVEDSFHGFGLVDGWRDVVTYFDIEKLLQSDAWKELIYITPNTDFLASGYDHRKKRQVQPETWDAMIKERDGGESGAEVEMWITPESGASVGEGRTVGEPRPWAAIPGHEVIQNWRLAAPDQDLKGEVRIVARRGKRAIAVQTGLSEKKSWKELKTKEGGFRRADWSPYYNDMADALGWVYGGWGRRMQLAHMALNQ
ncbi:hypothetical protein K458DRAFT_413005 [Lentithecium fluviatile CBS 122367]|uniref:F-box domain-containing protein n=1 Tax=Lentithecium fluviatile CBS 122367 TaxID=1168545 RepID=A0A6G1JJ55_9PLEO|nr:hypothetical protein K458DRAFT_413005 [Lentithecium fluviatile CBS 122367]